MHCGRHVGACVDKYLQAEAPYTGTPPERPFDVAGLAAEICGLGKEMGFTDCNVDVCGEVGTGPAHLASRSATIAPTTIGTWANSSR